MPQRSRIRVLLVDDHGLIRAGFREQLTSVYDFSVVGEAASVEQAVERVRQLTPHIVLLDLNLPDGSGIQACRRILAVAPATRVLIMTICDDSSMVQAALAAGAHGYVLKDIGPDLLVEAVQTVAMGALFFHPRSIRESLSASSAVSDPAARDGLGKLSWQEQRILLLLGEGRTNKEIGDVLVLSENTVKNYLSNMFRKLNITRRTRAVTLYLRKPRHDSSKVSLSA